MDGILIVDKPQGPTSHDVVVEVRRLTGDRKIGHGGTLDPLATGVLALMLGRARRLSRFIQAGDKTYLCTIRFGLSTTTDDIEGEVLDQRPGETDIGKAEAALVGLVGTYPQTPPVYSAVKIAGQAMHKSARAGRPAIGPPREVTVHSLDIMELRDGDYPEVDVHVVCSKGTYVRALARDAGERAGAGACVAALRREASGEFTLAQAHRLEELQEHARQGVLAQDVLPLEAALGGMSRAVLSDGWAKRVSHGVKPTLSDMGQPTRPPAWGQPIALLSPSGRLIAIAEPGGGAPGQDGPPDPPEPDTRFDLLTVLADSLDSSGSDA